MREAITQLLSEGFLFRTAGRGAFVSDRPAQPKHRPAARASRNIGFGISASIFNFVQPGYNQILAGVGEVWRNPGFRVQFHGVDETKDSLDEVFVGDVTGGVDGNLVVGGVNRRSRQQLERFELPLPLVDLLVTDGPAETVRIDYASGTRQAIKHLKALGHYEAFWESLENADSPTCRAIRNCGPFLTWCSGCSPGIRACRN